MADETKKASVENTETEKTKESKKAKSKQNAEIEAIKSELEKTNDILMRTAAEFDNFKKRTEREKTSIGEYAKASIIKELLPLIDNAGRAFAADSSSPEYTKGLEMIVKQLSSLPDKLSVETLAEIGDEFDPNYHEAVMHVEDDSVGENVIVEILQQGYKFGDSVIRPAMVKVAN